MNIVTMSNKAYAKWVNVFGLSLLRHNPGCKITVLTLEEGVPLYFPCDTIPVQPPKGLKCSLDRVKLSFANLNRFKLRGRWIWFDPDILIRGDITPIWESGHFSGALTGTMNFQNGKPDINCGMTCFEDVDYDDLMKFCRQYGETWAAEQEMLSAYFWKRGEVKVLPARFNSTPSYMINKKILDVRAMRANGQLANREGPEIVIHWAGGAKWDYHRGYKSEHYQHLKGIYEKHGPNAFGEIEQFTGEPQPRRLVTITDNKFWKYTAIMLRSFYRNAGVEWPVLILTKEPLKKEARDMLSEYGDIEPMEKYGKIDWKSNPKLYKNSELPRLSQNLGNPVKFAVPGPCLYVDSDVYFAGNIQELEYYRGIWACFHWEDFRERPVPSRDRMNGGVFLYDGDKDLFEKIRVYFEHYPLENPFGEQYMLRKFFKSQKLSINNLPLRFNRRWGQVDPIEDIRIYHFSGPNKPDTNLGWIHEPFTTEWRNDYRELFGDRKWDKKAEEIRPTNRVRRLAC